MKKGTLRQGRRRAMGMKRAGLLLRVGSRLLRKGRRDRLRGGSGRKRVVVGRGGLDGDVM